MASTYRLEVVEAARWVSAPQNQTIKGEALTNALQAQNWDPSVKALVPFPWVLENMSNQLQWTEELGNAFLAQQADVMAAVQRLRHEAMAAGNLKQTPQCRCVVQVSGDTISILPAEPQVVCVPVYRPTVYGSWPYPAYPPDYFPIPVGFAYEPGFWIGFEPPIELAFFGPLWGWGRVDWGHHDIAVDPGHYGVVSGGAAFTGGVWVHDPAHRGGVAYADPVTRARFNPARISALTAATRFGAARGEAVPRLGGAHSGAARSDPALGGTGRLGAAAAAVHGGAAAFHGEATFHGSPAFHGRAAFRGGAGFHGAPTARGSEASRSGPATFRGSAAFHGGGPQGGGVPHFAMGGAHGGGGPHFAVSAPHGGGSYGGGVRAAMGGGSHGGGPGGASHGGGSHGGGPGGASHGGGSHGGGPDRASHGGGPHGGGPDGHYG